MFIKKNTELEQNCYFIQKENLWQYIANNLVEFLDDCFKVTF